MDGKGKINVLLVDDDDAVLNTLSTLVEHAGWKCFKAPTGEIAVDSFKLNDIDIVVLDINLPAMDGFTVLKELKVLKPNVPIIMLTGLGYDKEQIDKAVKFGASGYVSKAMPVRNIISKIKAVLGQK